MGWKEAEWTCLDCETTGLEAGKDKIVEVGVVVFRAGDVRRRYSWLVSPGFPIPQEATAVHGIKDEDVEGAPTFDQVAAEVLDAVTLADVLVGYNWPFDASFLEAELGDAWRKETRGKTTIDPLVVVRFKGVGKYWSGKGRHRLEAVAKRLGVRASGDAHRVEADCEMTLLVLDKLKGHLPDDGREATQLIERRRREQDADFNAWLARQKDGERSTKP